MGQRWFTLTLDGFAAHAGTTPMHSRRDALTAFAELALKVERLAIGTAGRTGDDRHGAYADSRNVVPSRVVCSVEFRHPQSRRWKRWNRRCIVPLQSWRHAA
jgi:N-carbamoyl-L-amino-acid hydrolase